VNQIELVEDCWFDSKLSYYPARTGLADDGADIRAAATVGDIRTCAGDKGFAAAL